MLECFRDMALRPGFMQFSFGICAISGWDWLARNKALSAYSCIAHDLQCCGRDNELIHEQGIQFLKAYSTERSR